MARYEILHNPRCSKSRAALERLADAGVQPTIVEYLVTPPTRARLERILALLGTDDPRTIMRTGGMSNRSRVTGAICEQSGNMQGKLASRRVALPPTFRAFTDHLNSTGRYFADALTKGSGRTQSRAISVIDFSFVAALGVSAHGTCPFYR